MTPDDQMRAELCRFSPFVPEEVLYDILQAAIRVAEEFGQFKYRQGYEQCRLGLLPMMEDD